MIINGDSLIFPDVFGCDFTTRALITVVIFDGHSAYGVDLQKRINNFYSKISKYTSAKFNLTVKV